MLNLSSFRKFILRVASLFIDRDQLIWKAIGLNQEADAIEVHDIQQAIELRQLALEILQSIKYERAVIASLLALARLNMGARQYAQSKKLIREAQRLNDFGNIDAVFEMDTIAAMAELAFYQSRHDEALRLFDQVIKKAVLLGRNEYTLISSNFMMDIYKATRDFEAIINLYESTVEDAIMRLSTQQEGNLMIIHRAENQYFVPYITALVELKRYDKAEEKTKILISQINKMTGKNQVKVAMKADAINLLGTIYNHRWKHHPKKDAHSHQYLLEAERLYRQALEILQPEDKRGLTWQRVVFNLALVAEEKGQYSESKQLHTQLIDINRREQHLTSLATTLTHRGKAYLKLGNYEQAVNDLLEAVQLTETLRGGTLEGDAQRVAYQQIWNYPYQYAVEALLRLGGREKDVVTILEMNKSRSLVEQMAKSELSPPHSIPMALLKSEQELIITKTRLIANLSNPSKTSAELLKFTQELQDINSDLSNIYDQMARISPDYVAMRRGQAYDYKMIRELLADEATIAERLILVVEYFITETETFAIGIRSDWEVPRVEKIAISEEKLQQYHDEFTKQLYHSDLELTVRFKADDFNEALRPLIEPVYSWCNPLTLVCIVPHMFLNELPLHAVHIDGKPFAEHNEVVYNWSATLLLNAAKKRKATPSHILAVSDTNTAKRVPMSRYQTYAIAQLFESSHILVGDNATKAQIENTLERHHKDIDTLLFGVHGIFSSTSSKKGSDQTHLELHDKNLFLKDIMAWTSKELKIGLVTLNACESGRSESLLGDELMGLTRAFLYATDTPSIIVSMWKADDLATCLVTIKFYELWLRGYSKANALRQAIISLRTATRMQILELLQNARKRLEDDTEAINEIDTRIQQFKRIPDGFFDKLGFWSTFILVGDWN